MKLRTILILVGVAIAIALISLWMGQQAYSWFPPQASAESILIDNLFKYIEKDDVCILDIERNYLEPWRFNKPTFEQWLLIFKKNHPYLLHMINKIVFYIDKKFEPEIQNFKILNTKQKILHITGPDSFTKVIKEYIRHKNILHRNLDYNKLAMVNNFSIFNYHKMYEINGKKHYSKYNEPLYKI